MSFGWLTVPWDPNKISFQTLIKLIVPLSNVPKVFIFYLIVKSYHESTF